MSGPAHMAPHDPGAPVVGLPAPVRGADGWISEQTRQIGGFAARALPSQGDDVKVFHLPRWKDGDDRGRVAALRQIALEAGRDPRMATVAVAVCRAAGAPPRAYEKQAAALLRFVQERVYYVNEPGERLQDPFYTLKVGYGDCDDMALLLAALAESMRLPWRMTISGTAPSAGRPRMVRWSEGEPYPSNVKWSHIYVRLGWPAFQPTTWVSAEPTIKGVPLGWDVVDTFRKNGKVVLPELAGVELAGPGDSGPGDIVAPLPFWEHVVRDIKGKLHPRALIPAVVVGLVVGAVAEGTRRALSRI